jgi:hypothetical protein
MTDKEAQTKEFGSEILLFLDELLRITDIRCLRDKSNYGKIFKYYALQEIRNSFYVFLLIANIEEDKKGAYLAQISTIGRNIYEIFLTIFLVTQTKTEELFFACSAKEDLRIYEFREEIKKIKDEPSMSPRFLDELKKNAKHFEELSKKHKGKYIKKGGLIGPGDIVDYLERNSKDPFFKTMKIGHKNYYNLLCIASHFRPSTATSNIPYFSDPKILLATKKITLQITFRITLMVIEVITKRLIYTKRHKQKYSFIEKKYEEVFEDYYSD